MDRRLINTLIINDNDLKCDLIIYTGKRGTKILKSKYFKSGKITAG